MRIIKILTALLAGLSLSSSPAQTVGEKHYLVGFAQDTMANDWRKAQVNALQAAFAKYPEVRFVYTNAKGDTARQISDMENLASQKVDVLIASPRSGLAATPVVSRIYRSGTPVVLITRGVAGEDYTSLVAPDDRQIAAGAAHHIAEMLHGKGRVLVLQGVPTASTAQARTDGFLDAIEAYPGLAVVAITPANYLRADAIRAVEQALANGLQFDAIFAQSDSMATGARMALTKAGLGADSKLIVGIDYITEAREAIRRGEQSASFLYPTCAEQTAAVVMDVLAGKAVPKRVVVESRKITRDNVDEIAPIF